MWALRGYRPSASSRRKYEWGYLFSVVRPSTGETVNVVGTSVSSAIMSAVLAQFAKDAAITSDNRAVVVIDGAGWHTARDLVVPEGVHLAFLPAYSPELQPAERLWPIVNEGVANRYFATLPELITRIEERCLHLDRSRDLVRRLTHYHWWPSEPRNEG